MMNCGADQGEVITEGDSDQTPTRTKVVVLMDEAEERRPSKQMVSSVPLLQRLLENCTVHLVPTSRPVPAQLLRQWIDLTSPHTALLYPSEASTPLQFMNCSGNSDDVNGDNLQSHDSNSTEMLINTLVVLDGSWRSVQYILHHNKLLQSQYLRHVRLDLAASYTSYYQTYGLRQEPAPNCVSTAEAVALALMRIESASSSVGHSILTEFRRFVLMNTDIVCEDKIRESAHNSDENNANLSRKRKIYDGVSTVASDEANAALLHSKGMKDRKHKTCSAKRKCRRRKEKKRKK